jgi:hypothetical protein
MMSDRNCEKLEHAHKSQPHKCIFQAKLQIAVIIQAEEISSQVFFCASFFFISSLCSCRPFSLSFFLLLMLNTKLMKHLTFSSTWIHDYAPTIVWLQHHSSIINSQQQQKCNWERQMNFVLWQVQEKFCVINWALKRCTFSSLLRHHCCYRSINHADHRHSK